MFSGKQLALVFQFQHEELYFSTTVQENYYCLVSWSVFFCQHKTKKGNFLERKTVLTILSVLDYSFTIHLRMPHLNR